MSDFNFWCVCGGIGAAASVLVGLGFGIIVLLRHSLTELSVTRSGFTAKMNNNPVTFEIMGEIERIDSEMRRSIREATTDLELMDTEKHGTSTEVRMVNLVANQPLVNSAYENHHTRELSEAGADGYLENKANSVRKAVKAWKKDVAALRDELINAYVYYWASTAVMPNVRRSCEDKLTYYKKLLRRYDVGESVKDNIRLWIEKNEGYLHHLEKLAERSDIIKKSSIFINAKDSGNG